MTDELDRLEARIKTALRQAVFPWYRRLFSSCLVYLVPEERQTSIPDTGLVVIATAYINGLPIEVTDDDGDLFFICHDQWGNRRIFYDRASFLELPTYL